jgi:hypothetical protein
MTLKGDGDFRGFRLDDHVLGIFKTENVVQLVELNASLNDAAGNEKAQEDGQLVLEVDNPLKQNIIATLMHSPTVNLVRTYESQLFLEILHGYVPPTAP